jgi:hypothetical protein
MLLLLLLSAKLPNQQTVNGRHCSCTAAATADADWDWLACLG